MDLDNNYFLLVQSHQGLKFIFFQWELKLNSNLGN